MRSTIIILCIVGIFANQANGQQKYKPVIDGEWWQVAGNPDLGNYTTFKQQPVDFAVWQASDGTWHLWSCIRGTKCGEHTRLFYKWESHQLTDKDWEPGGIAMEADTMLGEGSGGLQAPFVFKSNKSFYMVYGGWDKICLAISEDGKDFRRVLNEAGESSLFTGPFLNSRDPNILQENGLFYCYYTGHTHIDTSIIENGQRVSQIYKSAVFCRTSADLKNWSEPVMVVAGGEAGTKSSSFGGDSECPFVLKKDGYYYLFRNQIYGQNSLNTQYASANPIDFGVGHDGFNIGTLPAAAIEVVFYNNEYYLFALNPGLDGIRAAKLKWEILE